MFKQKSNSRSRIDTLIGAKTRIDGDVHFAGGFHIDGHVKGNVMCEPGGNDVLSVSEEGCIEGSVAVPNIILNGIVKGDIEASGRVELGPRAQVLGSVHYTTIETAVGARITGKLRHHANQGGNQGPRTGDSEPT
jgi:cytoskeletal protein CcmA (bactofilin family)